LIIAFTDDAVPAQSPPFESLKTKNLTPSSVAHPTLPSEKSHASSTLFKYLASSSQFSPPIKLVPYFSTQSNPAANAVEVAVVVVVGEVVAVVVVVWLVVAVVVVVGDEVGVVDVVAVVVVVGVDVTVVDPVDEADVVPVVLVVAVVVPLDVTVDVAEVVVSLRRMLPTVSPFTSTVIAPCCTSASKLFNSLMVVNVSSAATPHAPRRCRCRVPSWHATSVDGMLLRSNPNAAAAATESEFVWSKKSVMAAFASSVHSVVKIKIKIGKIVVVGVEVIVVVVVGDEVTVVVVVGVVVVSVVLPVVVAVLVAVVLVVALVVPVEEVVGDVVPVVEVVAVVVPVDVDAVTVAVVVAVVVVVSDVVAVVLVVADVVAVDVKLDVALVVPVDDAVVVAVVVVVGDVVALVVALVVGVVTSQSWKPPAAYASVIAFSDSATSSQSSPAIKIVLNAQATDASSPAGPRNSRAAVLMASFVAAQVLASTTNVFFPDLVWQPTVPVLVP